MSAGGARRGRRDNGLHATEYAVVGDVDPRIGEHLLDVLAAGGIAAYLQPSSDLNPVTRTTTVPARPTDRLYVDRSHVATAREYLRQLTDEGLPRQSGNDPDIEAEWARIVANFHAETTAAGQRPWPAAEDTDDPVGPAGSGGAAGGAIGPASPRGDQEAGGPATGVRQLPWAADVSGISLGRTDDGRTEGGSLLDGLDTFGANLPDDPEDRFIPPPPPPLPRISKYAVAGVLGVTLGFILFLFPALLPLDRGVVVMIGFVSILSGFVTLIWRLRPGDDEEDDPNDGAVV